MSLNVVEENEQVSKKPTIVIIQENVKVILFFRTERSIIKPIFDMSTI